MPCVALQQVYRSKYMPCVALQQVYRSKYMPCVALQALYLLCPGPETPEGIFLSIRLRLKRMP